MDEPAVGEAYRLYAASIWRRCVSIVRNDAREAPVAYCWLPRRVDVPPSGFELTQFRLGRSGAGVGVGIKGLQAVENIGNRSESNSHSAPPEAPFSSDFVSGLCLEKRLNAGGSGRRDAPDRLLSVKQVAENLGVTTATVYSLCADGRLAHVRILNTIRVAPSDLAAFIDSHRSPAAVRPRHAR